MQVRSASPNSKTRGRERPLTWQEENGCELILSGRLPTPETLEELLEHKNILHAAYLRTPSGIYYVNKKTKEIRLLFVTEKAERYDPEKEQENENKEKENKEKLECFDSILQVFAQANRRLTDQELKFIEALTGHTHRSRWQRFLYRLGLVCSAVMALGSGVSTAAAFVGLNLMTGGAVTVIAALLFIAGTAVNWWLYKKYVSPVLVDMFGREKFFVDEEDQSLSTGKKVILGGSLVLALSVGATFAALTYSSTFALTSAFTFLGAVSVALPPVAIILASVAFICLTALMIQDIATLIKKKDVIGECKTFLKDLVSIDLTLPRNKDKSTRRIVAERVLAVLLTVIFVPLAAIGLYMTMNACVPGVKAMLLEKIPSASQAAVEVFSKVVSLGLAFVGQIPFTVQTICLFVSRLFGAKKPEQASRTDSPAIAEPDKASTGHTVVRGLTAPLHFSVSSKVSTQPHSRSVRLWRNFQVSQIVVNGVGNGFIAMVGASGPFIRGTAFTSGTANSVLAGASAVEADSVTLSLSMAGVQQDDLSYYMNQKKLAKAIADEPRDKSTVVALPDRMRWLLEEKSSFAKSKMVLFPAKKESRRPLPETALSASFPSPFLQDEKSIPVDSIPQSEKSIPKKARAFSRDDLPVRYRC